MLSTDLAYSYDTSQLNWKWARKNICSVNVQKAIGLKWSPGNATDWQRFGDKSNKDIVVGDVIVIGKHNKVLKSHKWGWMYGHVAIAKEVKDGRVLMYDGPNAYSFWTSIENIDAVISEEKMIELGAKNIID